MKKVYSSIFIFLIIQVNISGQWDEIHLSDTSYFAQFGVSNLVESNSNLIALAGPLFNSLFISSDKGANWNHLPFEKAVHGIYSTGKILFLDTYYDSQFFRTSDNGKTWTNIDTTFLLFKTLPEPSNEYEVASINAFAFDSTELFIGTEAGIFRSQDNGINWTQSSNGLPNDYYNVHVIPVTKLLINGSKMYAGTRYGGIYISTDNGSNWKSINDGLPEGSYDFPDIPKIETLISNGSTIFALLHEGGIYRLLEGNKVWGKTQTGISGGVESIATKDSILFAVTGREIYSSEDNGINWNEIYTSSLFESGSSVRIKMFDSVLYLLGVSFGVYSSSDNGNTWISRNEGLGEQRIRYPLQIDVYDSILGVTTDDYKTFISRDLGNNWQNVTISDTNVNNYVDNDTSFFKLFNYCYVKKEETWYQMFNFSLDEMILVDTTLLRIGTTLTTSQVYRGSFNNYEIINNEFTTGWKLCLEGSYGYYSLAAKGNNIYVAASDGIYLSSDFGITWNQVGLQNKRVGNLVLSNTNLIAQTNGGFYKSLDGGYNWSTINLSLDNIVELELCRDKLIALTISTGSPYNKIWKRSFNEILTNLKERQILPDKFSLSQNYPNPFNPTTIIGYSIPKASFVTLKVYDVLGREVATLVNKEKSIGNYNVEFNGSGLSSGIYFYKIQAGDYSSVKKMVLVK